MLRPTGSCFAGARPQFSNTLLASVWKCTATDVYSMSALPHCTIAFSMRPCWPFQPCSQALANPDVLRQPLLPLLHHTRTHIQRRSFLALLWLYYFVARPALVFFTCFHQSSTLLHQPSTLLHHPRAAASSALRCINHQGYRTALVLPRRI